MCSQLDLSRDQEALPETPLPEALDSDEDVYEEFCEDKTLLSPYGVRGSVTPSPPPRTRPYGPLFAPSFSSASTSAELAALREQRNYAMTGSGKNEQCPANHGTARLIPGYGHPTLEEDSFVMEDDETAESSRGRQVRSRASSEVTLSPEMHTHAELGDYLDSARSNQITRHIKGLSKSRFNDRDTLEADVIRLQDLVDQGNSSIAALVQAQLQAEDDNNNLRESILEMEMNNISLKRAVLQLQTEKADVEKLYNDLIKASAVSRA